MSSQTTKQLGRRLALIGALAALTIGAGSATAFATITEVEPDPILNEEPAVVKGSVPGGASAVALAICNVDVSPVGSACSAVPGSFTNVTPHAGPYEIELTVFRTFTNFSFIPPMGPSGGETECFDENEKGSGQCAVIASYYAEEEEAYVPFGPPSVFPVAVN